MVLNRVINKDLNGLSPRQRLRFCVSGISFEVCTLFENLVNPIKPVSCSNVSFFNVFLYDMPYINSNFNGRTSMVELVEHTCPYSKLCDMFICELPWGMSNG